MNHKPPPNLRMVEIITLANVHRVIDCCVPGTVLSILHASPLNFLTMLAGGCYYYSQTIWITVPSQATGLQIVDLPLSTWMTSGKLIKLSVLSFLICKVGVVELSALKDCSEF